MVGGRNSALLFLCFFVLNHLMSLIPDSDWDCGEEEFQEGEDMCNTLLITGPTGVGKTAAVYACAQELGFKVQTLSGGCVEKCLFHVLTGPPASPGV